jgi:BCD family chlorophyll transporter-like MFS transporter
MSGEKSLPWLGIIRLGLVQAALGAMVVLATTTMNRVMVVELRLPALVPGLLVALQYGVQVLRPRAGYGSDVGGRRTPWIAGGLGLLALGCVGAAAATAWMSVERTGGLIAAVAAYLAVGIGVGTGGTALLALMAARVAPQRRAPAATILWLMMIAGIAVTAITAGRLLDPFSPGRLVGVTAAVAVVVLGVALLALRGMDGGTTAPADPAPQSFSAALRDVLAEPQSRRFAVFVFVSMLAYSAQELLLEPFAGAVFGFTPGQHGAGRHGRHGAGAGDAALDDGRLPGLRTGAAGAGGGGTDRAGLAAARLRDGAGRGERRVRRLRDRRDDGTGPPGTPGTRGHAHGRLGRGAGAGLRAGRHPRHQRQRSGAAGARHGCEWLRRGVRGRGASVHRGRHGGGARVSFRGSRAGRNPAEGR